jgi:hypothetical protein
MSNAKLDPLENTITNYAGDVDCPIHVLTVATKLNQGAHNFLASLRVQGYRYTVLGWRQPWQGWRQRMAWYRDACNALPPQQLVALVDAYDVVAMRPWHGIDTAFDSVSKGRGVVGGMEMICFGNCTPLDSWWAAENRAPQQSGVKYVNGGIMVGRAVALADAYNWMLEQGATDDQMGMAAFANAFPNKFAADDGSVIGSNKVIMTPLTSDEVNGTGAYFCHFPGVSGYSNSAYSIDNAWSAHSGALVVPTQRAWWDWGIPLICSVASALIVFLITFFACKAAWKTPSVSTSTSIPHVAPDSWPFPAVLQNT